MRKDLVVVLSSDKDTTACDVLSLLRKRGSRCVMLNTGDFPASVRLDASFAGQQWQGEIIAYGEAYRLEDIKSILYRRPTQYKVSSDMPEQVQAFAENEAVKGFGGVLRSLRCFWMSRLEALRFAEFKPRQLKHASKLGMRVPRTLITNDPSAVRRFYQEQNGNIIYKTLHGGNIQVNDEEYDAIFTSRVLSKHLSGLDARVPLTANMFQEAIEKAFELRITVVGNRTFPCAIYSRSGESCMDFRAHYEDLSYEIFQLPQEIQMFCINLVKSFGLQYGAIDMAVTPDGEYVFFEINASGQYQWIEYYTKMPITEAIVDRLIAGH